MLKKTFFWKNIMDTMALIGSLTTGGMGAMQQWADAHITGVWYVASGVLAIIGLVLRIWVVDANNNGVIDVAER